MYNKKMTQPSYTQDLIDLADFYITNKKGTASLAKWKTPLYLKLLDQTAFLPSTSTCTQRLHHVHTGTYTIPVCMACDKEVKWHTTNRPAGYSRFCGVKCASKDKTTLAKRADTCMEKYGVSTYSQTDMHKEQMSKVSAEVWTDANEKREQTLQRLYGVSSAVHVPGSSDKRKATNIELYGHTNVLASDMVKQIKIDRYGTSGYSGTEQFKEQRKLTMIERYGVEYSGQSKELLGKRHDTCLARHGTAFPTNSHISKESMDHLCTPQWLSMRHLDDKVPLSAIALELGVDLGTVRYRFELYQLETKRYPSSYAERQITELFDRNKIQYIQGDRKILNGKELDFVIESQKIAIEYCGLYWHSSAHLRNTSMYHANKLKQCNAAGYRLITIFEDEWVHSRQLVELKILNILGINESDSVYARNCKIIEVGGENKRNFFNSYHIQGTGPGSITLGLQYSETIVAMMSFIKQADGVYILNRYATSCNVPGGFSKLLSHFKRTYDWTEIVSFADLRWSTGAVYDQNGFTLDKTLLPDYYYVDTNKIKRIHKFNFRHSNLPKILGERYDPSLSETENTKANNWFKIYNCGLLRYALTH